MAGIVKTVIRFGVIAGLGTGAAVLVAGPERVGALVSSARSRVIQTIDSHIDDPTVLRAQLRELAEQYPDRIAEVRGDLAELQEQMRQMASDKVVSERVVALAESDLGVLQPMLERAQAARAAAHPGQAVLVSLGSRDMTLEQAYSRATQISQTRNAYATRVADADRTLDYLGQQEERLQALLTKLENEQAEFQTQLWQLDHQVDAIARNDRLLEMLEKRQKEIDDQTRYDVVSLEQVNQRLAQIRAKQESQFQALDQSAHRLDYEDVARQQVEAEQTAEREFQRSLQGAEPLPADPIRIGPGEDDGDSEESEHVASRPIRIF